MPHHRNYIYGLLVCEMDLSPITYLSLDMKIVFEPFILIINVEVTREK